MTAFNPGNYTQKTPKPMPVLLLLDKSGSMFEQMGVLNAAVKDMLQSFKDEEKMETEIHVAVITFGDDAEVVYEFTKASVLITQWNDLEAEGMTALGDALKKAKQMLEDKVRTPGRAYRPTVVLVSDGYPNDKWKQALSDFVSTGRSSKCDRMAMAIGSDVDEEMLKFFLNGTNNSIQYAHNAGDIKNFFKKVTMSTIMRTRSMNPNVVPSFDEIDLDC